MKGQYPPWDYQFLGIIKIMGTVKVGLLMCLGDGSRPPVGTSEGRARKQKPGATPQDPGSDRFRELQTGLGWSRRVLTGADRST